MRYAFIEDHRTTWPIAIQCRVLAVSRSGYYEWRRRPVSERVKRRESLTAAIRKFHVGHHESYGSPRVHRELQARGEAVNEKTVAKKQAMSALALADLDRWIADHLRIAAAA